MKQIKVEGKVLGYVSVGKAGGSWPVNVYDNRRRKITSVPSLRAAAHLLAHRHTVDIVERLQRKALNTMKRGWVNGRTPRG